MISNRQRLYRRLAFMGYLLAFNTFWGFFVRLGLKVLDPQLVEQAISGRLTQLPEPASLTQNWLLVLLVFSCYGSGWFIVIFWLVNFRTLCTNEESLAQLIQATNWLLTTLFSVAVATLLFAIYFEVFATSIIELRIAAILMELFTHAYVVLAGLVSLLCSIMAYQNHRFPHFINRGLVVGSALLIIQEFFMLNPELPMIRAIAGISLGGIFIVIFSTYFYILSQLPPHKTLKDNSTIIVK